MTISTVHSRSTLPAVRDDRNGSIASFRIRSQDVCLSPNSGARADISGPQLRANNGRGQMREALSNKEHAARPPDKMVSVIASVWWVSLRYVGTCLRDLAILN